MRIPFALTAIAALVLLVAGCDRRESPDPARAPAPPGAADLAGAAQPTNTADPASAASGAQATAASPGTVEPPVVPAAETPDAAALPPEEAPGKSEATLARIAQLPAEDQLPAGQWKPGVHYKPIVPAQPTNAPAGKVEVVEVFWYGCSHCYALDPFLESWKRNKPDYIEFVRLPVMWGQPVHRAHARLFYTLQSLGKLDALHTKVFNAIHRDRNLLAGNSDEESYRLQLAFAKANGISESDFKTAYDSFAVDTSLKRAEDLTRRYRVEGVPLLVVNGKYSTDIGMAGGHSQLLQLLNDLAAAEKRR